MRLKLTSTTGIGFLLLILGFSFERCSDKCQVTTRYAYYAPVYSTSAEIKAAVEQKQAQPIKKLGKLYFKDGILFVNEPGEGIHIIDNHDPGHPAALSFLNIPGNFDLAIRGNTLYADSYVDLVAFDVTHISDIKEINRIEGLFKVYNLYGMNYEEGRGIITSWKLDENVSVVETECDTQVQAWGGIYFSPGIAFAIDDMRAASTLPSPTTGIGGSMARFTIVDNYLYGLDGADLHIVDVSTETLPVAGTSIQISWDAQTLFPHNDKLFVGARAGMYIYDLGTPSQPTLIGQYDHITTCDPVVIEGDYAYVTLYDGGICHMGTNQLEVIDIKDLTSPSLLKTYPMTSPHGLGISNGILFICDGSDGLKIYDASDPLTISDHMLAHYEGIDALDVIPFDNTAMMIGANGIYQYDYSDITNIKLLSQISVVNP